MTLRIARNFAYIIFNAIDKFIYCVLYYLFYKFSGAHEKPTSDSKYDPSLKHQTNIFYRLVRYYENIKLKSLLNKHMVNQSTESDNLMTVALEGMEICGNNDQDKIVFSSKTQGKTKPLLIKGLIKDSIACNKWSALFFKNNYGDTKLLTLMKENDLKTKTLAYTSFTQKIDCQYTSLTDSIRNMLNEDKNNSYMPYINNVTEIFNKHPSLIEDLEINNISKIDDSINEKTWLKVNMFMGGPGTGSSLHCAVGGNFFFNIHGKKKWILIDPIYTPYLKTTPSENFGFVISGYDIENLNEFGKLNQIIPKYEVILEPGDVLYVPPWWWHYVHNETDFTIGCAIRDHTVYMQSIRNNPMFMFMSPYIYKLNPIIIKIIEFFKGRKFLLRKSMESDKHIMKHLTGKFI